MTKEEAKYQLENYIRDNSYDNGFFILPEDDKTIMCKVSFDVEETISESFTFKELVNLAYEESEV